MKYFTKNSMMIEHLQRKFPKSSKNTQSEDIEELWKYMGIEQNKSKEDNLTQAMRDIPSYQILYRRKLEKDHILKTLRITEEDVEKPDFF